jgi:hypothetical protein
MSGFEAFAGKEAREILRTWRIWVLPGILLLFALTGPVLAKLTPQLLGAVGGDQFKGLVLPAPTYHEAYAEWIKDLSGTALFVLIIVYGSIISSERKSGTAVLVRHLALRWPAAGGAFRETSLRSYLVDRAQPRKRNRLRTRAEAAPTWHKPGFRRPVTGSTTGHQCARRALGLRLR